MSDSRSSSAAAGTSGAKSTNTTGSKWFQRYTKAHEAALGIKMITPRVKETDASSPHALVASTTVDLPLNDLKVYLGLVRDEKGVQKPNVVTMSQYYKDYIGSFGFTIDTAVTANNRHLDVEHHTKPKIMRDGGLVAQASTVVALPAPSKHEEKGQVRFEPATNPTPEQLARKRGTVTMGFRKTGPNMYEPIKLQLLERHEKSIKELEAKIYAIQDEIEKLDAGAVAPGASGAVAADSKELQRNLNALELEHEKISQNVNSYKLDQSALTSPANIVPSATASIMTATEVPNEVFAAFAANRSNKDVKVALDKISNDSILLLIGTLRCEPKFVPAPTYTPPLSYNGGHARTTFGGGTGPRNSYTLGVKLLSGRTFSVMVGPTDSVAALKQRIFEREGVPPQRQNLLVGGRQLQPDTRALSEYALKPGDMVYVTAGLRGQSVPEPMPVKSAPTRSATLGGADAVRADIKSISIASGSQDQADRALLDVADNKRTYGTDDSGDRLILDDLRLAFVQGLILRDETRAYARAKRNANDLMALNLAEIYHDVFEKMFELQPKFLAKLIFEFAIEIQRELALWGDSSPYHTLKVTSHNRATASATPDNFRNAQQLSTEQKAQLASYDSSIAMAMQRMFTINGVDADVKTAQGRGLFAKSIMQKAGLPALLDAGVVHPSVVLVDTGEIVTQVDLPTLSREQHEAIVKYYQNVCPGLIVAHTLNVSTPKNPTSLYLDAQILLQQMPTLFDGVTVNTIRLAKRKRRDDKSELESGFGDKKAAVSVDAQATPLSDAVLLDDIQAMSNRLNEEYENLRLYGQDRLKLVAYRHLALSQVKGLLGDYKGKNPDLVAIHTALQMLPDVKAEIIAGELTSYSVAAAAEVTEVVFTAVKSTLAALKAKTQPSGLLASLQSVFGFGEDKKNQPQALLLSAFKDAKSAITFLTQKMPTEAAARIDYVKQYAKVAHLWNKDHNVLQVLNRDVLLESALLDAENAIHVFTSPLHHQFDPAHILQIYQAHRNNSWFAFKVNNPRNIESATRLVVVCGDVKLCAELAKDAALLKLFNIQTAAFDDKAVVPPVAAAPNPHHLFARNPEVVKQDCLKYFLEMNVDPYEVLGVATDEKVTKEKVIAKHNARVLPGFGVALTSERLHMLCKAKELAFIFIDNPTVRAEFLTALEQPLVLNFVNRGL